MKRIIPFLFIFMACSKESKELPYLGNHTTVTSPTGEKTEKYYEIPAFSLRNQDSLVVNNQTLKGKVYIADFIFLQCPTICPKMNTEMKRVYDTYSHVEEVVFVSHTIDPKNDSIPVLKAYSESLGVNPTKWYFLHGDEAEIHQLAQGYFMQAYQENNAPGGYAHSGGFLLIDQQQHIRGVYDGTNPADVDRLSKEIQLLLKEKM
ncbi:SCO family protein [Myroides sp. WP-1]|uniref:SCO family protein n=1 Tax=Myroides sp. WP-1 TaxID=2759944 RepID=UPI00210236BC|nr:SCO family protein [Myroides sp. WP-1]